MDGTPHIPARPPPPIPRPALARWIWERGLYLKDVALAIGCSIEHVRRICLPFADPGRKVPEEPLLRAIIAYTDGAVGLGDFYPADLAPIPGDPRGGDTTILRHARSL